MAVIKQYTRVRTLGRGASGAEVFLAAHDDASGELFAVKSAPASGAAALKREQAIMSSLRSPRVVSCMGGRGGPDGSYQLFLEFAPGGSLADEVARTGGSLEERAIRAYAADVAAGLAYLHDAGTVHGDVKARNVVIGADGRAKLADFGCARKACSGGNIIGGTPAFMAPEVARGEQQGPAADVWALGCMVVEMATGRAPWTGMDGDALAAMHRIGYTDAVPEVPQWVSADAKDFLSRCLIRRPAERCRAAQLLEHPFLAGAGVDAKLEAVEKKWVSPKSTLDAAAFWESESETGEADDDEPSNRTAERIQALSCHGSALPDDWESDEGWIDVLSDAAAEPAEETNDQDDAIASEAEPGVVDITVKCSIVVLGAGEAEADSIGGNRHHPCLECLARHGLASCSTTLKFCNRRIVNDTTDFVLAQTMLRATASSSVFPLKTSLKRDTFDLRLISRFRHTNKNIRSRGGDSGSSRHGTSGRVASRACKWTPSREPAGPERAVVLLW